jgi:hypothetical protein
VGVRGIRWGDGVGVVVAVGINGLLVSNGVLVLIGFSLTVEVSNFVWSIALAVGEECFLGFIAAIYKDCEGYTTAPNSTIMT